MSKKISLKRDQILSAVDRVVESVDVPEWGGEGAVIYVRSLSGKERGAFEALFKDAESKPDTSELLARVIVTCAVDEEEQPLFSEADIAVLAERNAVVLSRVFQAAIKLNRIRNVDIEAAKGN